MVAASTYSTTHLDFQQFFISVEHNKVCVCCLHKVVLRLLHLLGSPFDDEAVEGMYVRVKGR